MDRFIHRPRLAQAAVRNTGDQADQDLKGFPGDAQRA